MSEQASENFPVEQLSELNFQKLSDNNYNVKFSILDGAGFDALKATQDEWRAKSNNLAVMEHISCWHIVVMSQQGVNHPILIGNDQVYGDPYVTSTVVTVAPDGSALITKSGSLYVLEHPSKDAEPQMSNLLQLVAALRSWGAGAVVKSWPKVVY